MDIASINFLQIFFNGLITGSIYFLAALGLSLTYSLLNFPNISHAEFLAFGAYAAYISLELIGKNFLLAIIVAFILTGLLGIFSYLIVFKPLSKRGSTSMHLAIASLGYGLFLRYSMYQIYGRESLTYKIWFNAFNIGPLRVTSLWILTIATSLILVFSLHLFLKKTLIGKAMRALSNNQILAMVCGIDKEKILLLVWFIGAGLAGIGGVFRAGDTRI
ncbi:MAG: branched-chain amino acid ABC transporter permease, partial [Nitrososphaerota archaeon]